MPASPTTSTTFEAHLDRLSTAAPTYTSRFSSFQGHDKAKATLKTKKQDAFTVSESERSATRATAVSHTNQYYDIVTRSYERNWSTHFHFAPFAPGDSIPHAVKFAVYRLAILLQLKPGYKVLDVGCGIGGAARELAKLVGCEVIGVTINQYQVDRAIELTAREGLGHLCTFIRADFMDLPFPDDHFDAVVAFEACCHAPSLAHVYAQCWKVLKPGQPFGFTEEVMTDVASGGAYNEAIEKHREVRNRIEAGGGMACLQSASAARRALGRAGFKIELDEDYASYFEKLSGPVPFVFADDASVRSGVKQAGDPNACYWNGKRVKSFSPVKIPNRSGEGYYLAPPPNSPYPAITSTKVNPVPPVFRPVCYPISGTKAAIAMAVTAEDRKIVSDMSHSNRRWAFFLTKVFVWLRLCPPGIVYLNKMLSLYLDGIVEGVQMDIFSPCWMFVGRKIRGRCDEELLKPQILT